jgi:predicted amidophosphoribosyltransferase
MKMKHKKSPMPPLALPPLFFRGLERCDGCGAQLRPRERLAGLCKGCALPLRKQE